MTMFWLYIDRANLCTLGGLLAGFGALVLLAVGDLWGALLAILTGAVADVFDGPLARSSPSRPEGAGPFGQELDTLADMCHSVLAPGLWVALAQGANATGIACGMLLAAAGATRLGYFTTVKPSRPGYFIGVPVTYVPIALGVAALTFGATASATVWLSFSAVMAGVQTGRFLFPKLTGWKFRVFAAFVVLLWLAVAATIFMDLPQ